MQLFINGQGCWSPIELIDSHRVQLVISSDAQPYDAPLQLLIDDGLG
jgi:hypothetical protein